MGLLNLFPVYERDIFLQYRPFPANPSNYYQAHWHEILFSLVFYSLLQLLSSHLSPIIFKSRYTTFSKKTRINFDIHIVSMVQCIILILLVIPTVNHHNFLSDNPVSSILGYTPYGGFVSSVTIGYFIWDTLVCLRYFNLFGPGFLFHGIAALFVFGFSLYPFSIPWIPAFLIFELSTPFVNINWFANRLPGFFPEWLVTINGLLLLITFPSVRIVWGFYAVFLYYKDLYHVWYQVPYLLPEAVLFLNVFLNLLNVYWFTKMLAIAKKTLTKKKKTV